MIVSEEVKKTFELNYSEMKRRRTLLKKEILNLKEKRELEILNARCFLITIDELKVK
jgi:hypothetical protein